MYHSIESLQHLHCSYTDLYRELKSVSYVHADNPILSHKILNVLIYGFIASKNYYLLMHD